MTKLDKTESNHATDKHCSTTATVNSFGRTTTTREDLSVKWNVEAYTVHRLLLSIFRRVRKARAQGNAGNSTLAILHQRDLFQGGECVGGTFYTHPQVGGRSCINEL